MPTQGLQNGAYGQAYGLAYGVSYPLLVLPTVELISPKTDIATKSRHPELKFKATEPIYDDLTYQLQIAKDTSFTVTVQDERSDSSGSFAGTDPYTSGDEISYTPDDLNRDQKYYWRVRAKAPNGRNEWSNWTDHRSFYVLRLDNYLFINDSSGEDYMAMTSPPFEEKILEGATDITTKDNNVSTYFTNNAREWTIHWDWMTEDQYELLRAYYKRQLSNNEFPSISIVKFGVVDVKSRMTLNARQVRSHCGDVIDVEAIFREVL